MNLKRLLLTINLVALIPLALWPIVSPRNFYENFPGGGFHWIDVNGPYNEHFLIDFGALNLALALVVGLALWKMTDTIVFAAGIALTAYALPHSIYHLNHLDVYKSGEEIPAVAPLLAQFVMGLAITWLSRSTITRTGTPTR